MGFFGGFTGSDQRKDMRNAYADSRVSLKEGYDTARGQLGAGYKTANQALGSAIKDTNTGTSNALAALGKGTTQAVSQYQPWATTGKAANTMYGNALGLNGGAAQQQFMRGYQGNPFLQQQTDFANRAIMQQLNARGMSGSGVAPAAIAQETMRRGAQDYNDYLDRLSGVSSQGLSASGQIANVYGNQGQQRASLYSQQGRDLANIQGQRAQTAYGYGAGLSGLATDYANTSAGNRINYGNAMASSRNILGNNLMGLLGTGVQAAAGGPSSALSGLTKMFGV